MVATDEPPVYLLNEADDSACLISTAHHPKFRLKADDDALFGTYLDWEHQNPGNHLYGGIKEGGKWQDRWRKKFLFAKTTLQRTVWSSQ